MIENIHFPTEMFLLKNQGTITRMFNECWHIFCKFSYTSALLRTIFSPVRFWFPLSTRSTRNPYAASFSNMTPPPPSGVRSHRSLAGGGLDANVYAGPHVMREPIDAVLREDRDMPNIILWEGGCCFGRTLPNHEIMKWYPTIIARKRNTPHF